MSTIPPNDRIHGVHFKALKTFPDDRGFFREVVRVTDPFFGPSCFGQWSHSKMTKNVVKAWHYHHIQTDWWYLPVGEILTVLYDNRAESPTYKTKLEFKMGESGSFSKQSLEVCVRIPPGVLHGCRVQSEEAHLFYITSHTYNPNDEGRFPFNSEVVPHDWGTDAITAENDRRTFIPTAQRSLISN